MIGIAGGSASGKTTFAEALVRELDFVGRSSFVINADRFFRRGQSGAPTFVSAATGLEEFDCNHPDTVDNASLGEEIAARCSGVDVLIVEGHLLFQCEDIRNRCDLRIFVELDADERALRRILRDMAGARGNPDPNFIARYYLESAKVGHAKYVEPSRVHADFTVRGDGDFTRTARMLTQIASSSLSVKPR